MQAIIEETFNDAFIKEENNSGYFARILYPKYDIVFTGNWNGEQYEHTFYFTINGKSTPGRKFHKGNYKSLFSRTYNKYLGSKKK